MTKNDEAWQMYFAKTDTLKEIERNGYTYITANSLKSLAEREPRLLVKIDTKNERPEVFKQNNISIFPVSNGRYILFQDPENKSFYQFSKEDSNLPIQVYNSDLDLLSYESYPGSQNLNESQALDFAYLSSLLSTFTGDNNLYLTIRSRIFSGKFQFSIPINNHLVDVSSVQIEIDAGYESRDRIVLIEAKVGNRDDFQIRQIYYPYLEWCRRTDKPITTIFLVISNSKFFFYEFSFSNDFGDITLIRKKCYTINESPIAQISLLSKLNEVTVEREPEDIPYPQANDLDKVVDLISHVKQGHTTKTSLAEIFEFDERQGDYYANAARYLSFISKSNNEFFTTPLGDEFLDIRPASQRTEFIIRQLMKRPTFRNVFQLIATRNLDFDHISNEEITSFIINFTNLTGSTPPRRASTVRSWLNWVAQNVEFS